ncbi:MAG: pyridoxal-phosphate-dependent aminotransferase family protein [Solirubrobacteraceae bacterium]
MSGRPFLQVPGPTNVPERVLRAMDRAVPDHRGPDLPPVVHELVERLRPLFGMKGGEIVLSSGSGTLAWEIALTNTLNPGDRVLAFNLGHFSHLFAQCAGKLGHDVDELDVEWGSGVPLDVLADKLAADRDRSIQAVLVVHNETSTGVTTNVAAVRQALDDAGHPALLLVDAVSSLASIEFLFDDWGVDVALTGSQKGLMLPPGMAVLAAGERALEKSRQVTTPRFFLDWAPVIEQMYQGYFPFTPPTLLLYGLREALRMLDEEGLEAVYARHARLAAAARAAAAEWGLELLCRDPAEYSNTTTAVVMPDGVDAGEVLRIAVERYQLSLGVGLGQLKGRVFRIGHLGSLNELEVIATIAGTELALHGAGVPVRLGAGAAACAELFAAAVGGRAPVSGRTPASAV